MIAPTVNILMTYRPEVMMAFQQSESFTAFTEEQKKLDALDKAAGRPQHTYVFNNAPNSTFLELKHSFNETDKMVLEVDIIDPQGVFEEAMIDNSVQAMMPINDDPLSAAIQRKIDEINYTSESYDIANWEIVNKLRNHFPIEQEKFDHKFALVDRAKSLLGEEAALNIANSGVGGEKDYLKLRQLEAARDAQTSQVQRPCYITYGVGDNLLDWSPPQCYGKVTSIEYSFNGGGARVLKLKFIGEGIHPNLTLGVGVSPFGKAFSDGLVTQGSSAPLFNKEIAIEEAKTFTQFVDAKNPGTANPATIEKYIGDHKRPSFHIAVTQAISEFIKAGSTEPNVLVLLPDLDKYLGHYVMACVGEAKAKVGSPGKYNRGNPDIPRQTREDVAYFEGFKNALEGIGLTLSDCTRYSQPGMPLSSAQPVGVQTFAMLESAARAEEEVDTWFQTKQYKAVVQCDYNKGTSFLDKLNQVSEALKTKFCCYVDKDLGALNLSMMRSPTCETDVAMLTIMKESSLIPSASKPLILWGDQRVIDSYLYARVTETTAQSAGATDNEWTLAQKDTWVSNKLEDRIHPIDILKGLDFNYLKKVQDTVTPIAWLGPFGPNNSGDADSILGDTNTLGGTNKLAQLKKNQPLQASRMPVFSFGTKNPNILDIDIDINMQYTNALMMAAPMPLPSRQIVTGVIRPGQASLVQQMFTKLEKFAKDAIAIDPTLQTPPDGFKKLIEKFYDEDGWFFKESKVNQEFSEWNLLFNNLSDASGDDRFSNINEQTWGDKEAYEQFMWTAFVSLYNKSREIPLSQKYVPGNQGADLAAIVTSTQMKESVINEVMAGSITTVPLFHLSTARNVMYRPCQVICLEPTLDPGKELSTQRTWFSGQYEIVGFKHTITSSTAQSEFQILKGASKGTPLNKGGTHTPDPAPVKPPTTAASLIPNHL